MKTVALRTLCMVLVVCPSTSKHSTLFIEHRNHSCTTENWNQLLGGLFELEFKLSYHSSQSKGKVISLFPYNLVASGSMQPRRLQHVYRGPGDSGFQVYSVAVCRHSRKQSEQQSDNWVLAQWVKKKMFDSKADVTTPHDQFAELRNLYCCSKILASGILTNKVWVELHMNAILSVVTSVAFTYLTLLWFMVHCFIELSLSKSCCICWWVPKQICMCRGCRFCYVGLSAWFQSHV